MYKIQTKSAFGWSDLKSSIDDGPYEVEVFESFDQANNELKNFCSAFQIQDKSQYRIVNADQEQDVDLYD
jgi:hypothetical protein